MPDADDLHESDEASSVRGAAGTPQTMAAKLAPGVGNKKHTNHRATNRHQRRNPMLTKQQCTSMWKMQGQLRATYIAQSNKKHKQTHTRLREVKTYDPVLTVVNEIEKFSWL